MKLSLAPLQGMTTAYYRNTFHDIFGGFDSYYAPFVTTTVDDHSSQSLFKDLFPENNNTKLNVVPQLLSNNGDAFIHYASYLTDMGYKEVNWNIGCPFPVVAKKKRGSGLLKHPDLIEQFLDKVCQNDSFDLSIKMRLGWDDLSEGLKIIDLLNTFPLKDVTIHARTGVQRYEGSVDLDGFEQMRNASKHLIIYNGDINTVADYNKVHERFPGLHAIMIGRGALRNPLLPALIKSQGKPVGDGLLKLKKFHDRILQHNSSVRSDDKYVCSRMKEFWSYLSYSLDPDHRYYNDIKKCQTIDDYTSTVDSLFKSLIIKNA